MSQVPNLCVDIFTQIANMFGTLQRVSTDPNNTFTHNGGFSQLNDPLTPQQPGSTDP